jgi:hypothetical protein
MVRWHLSEGERMKSIDEQIKNLPPALKKEVEGFVNGLLKKRRNKNGKKLRRAWAGAPTKGRSLKTRIEAEVSEAEHARILRTLRAVAALSSETGPSVSNRDHDRYLYGGQ